ncbi:histidine kinase [Arthrobacter sp. KNU-44]|uniref:histidine kinase n=1 Tax=Arthrobacter sp. KNU-44 TaxID=3450744 RepID=UPI003F4343A3
MTDRRGNPGLDPSIALAVLENAADGVVVCDDQMRYVWVNPIGCRIMGYALQELQGQDFLMTFPERMHAVMVESYRAQLKGSMGTYTGTLLTRAGAEVEMSWTNMTFKHGHRRYGAAVFRPIIRNAPNPRAIWASHPMLGNTHAPDLVERLGMLAEMGKTRTRALMVGIGLVDDDLVIRTGGRSGAPEGYGKAEREVSSAGGRIPFFDVWLTGRPVVVADARTRLRQDPAFAPLCDCLDVSFDWKTAVYISIGYGGRPLGGLAAYFPADVPAPTAEELEVLTSLADEASLAAEHSHLRHISQRTATLEERARLARELHDSVSQALFAMTLHTRGAMKKLDRWHSEDAAALRTTLLPDLSALAELTGTALAEMRALIFELRPESLQDAGLVVALTRQAAALSARSGIRINVNGPGERLPLDSFAEENAYRAVMEALNNAVKHSLAQAIDIAVTDLQDTVVITVADNGRGFDPSVLRPGHLGMETMHERADVIEAYFELHTAPGEGTTIQLSIPTSAGTPKAENNEQ